jgi:tripartite-type tricarboxylate transporter receptor subunit TctC
MKKIILLLALCATNYAYAVWPEKPIKLLIPYSAGGTSDIVARTIQPHLVKLLNQPVVIELVPGANGSIGAQKVMSINDNYTFLLTADEIIPNSIMEPTSGHSLVNFQPVVFMAHSPVVLGVNSKSLYKTVNDLLKAEKITYGNGGTRSIAYLTTSAARPGWTSIPYKGGGAMWPDVLAGHVDVSASSALQISSHVQGGTMKPMLVFNRTRLDTMPDVPTSYELGIPVSGSVWLGIVTPNATTNEAVNTFGTAVISALKDPSISQSLTSRGLIVEPKNSTDFAKYLKDSTNNIKKIIKE